ncbi:MAG: NAD-dependent epimerase/dehydratase family protein [Ectobacillus sp.]
MKRAVIIGALSFVGYHLVQKLLAEEIEVTAVDFDNMLNPSKVNEEKLLLIGRNANFMYESLHEADIGSSIRENQTAAVYFCLCEPNRYKELADRTVVYSYLQHVISLCKVYNKKLVLLSSINAATARYYETKGVIGPVSENGKFFYEMEKYVESLLRRYAIVQVPTVYGPWQPSFMAYHQLILADVLQRKMIVEVTENSEDAVYVADVADVLQQCGESEKLNGVYYIESNEAGQWQKGIALLNAGKRIRIREKRTEKKAAAPYPYPLRYSVKEGLYEQILHVKQYKALYEELG